MNLLMMYNMVSILIFSISHLYLLLQVLNYIFKYRYFNTFNKFISIPFIYFLIFLQSYEVYLYGKTIWFLIN
jgi:hypothetical protein